MNTLTSEDWMFDSLLEGAPLRSVRICRLYEYTREVTIWTENYISLGQHVMLLAHPELFTALFGFCITKPGCSRDWLQVAYFKLSSRIRDDLLKLYDSHLAALIDPTDESHDLPFLPVGSGPPFANVPHQKVRLDIPLADSQFARECFDAFLRQRCVSQGEGPGRPEGGNAEIRRLKNELRYLGALRLLRCMSAQEAIRHTRALLGHPLYRYPSRWSWAKRRAAGIIQRFEDELKPIKELFAHAPRDITSAQYDPTTGRLTYS